MSDNRKNYQYQAPVTNKMLLGYYPEWACERANVPDSGQYYVADTPVDVLTHMHYAFVKINDQFKVQQGEQWPDTGKRYTDVQYSVFGPMPIDTWNSTQQLQQMSQEQEKLENKEYDIKNYESLPKENWEMQGVQNNSYNYPFYGSFKRMQILKDFKKKYQGQDLKLVFSCGGWTWSDIYPSLIGSQANIDTFAQSCCDFATEYMFDGVDIDFEYIVFGPQGSYKTPKYEEAQQFTNLLQTVRRKLDELGEQTGKEYSLSITTSCDPDKMRPLEWHKIVAACDYVVLMTYDFAGAWDPTSAHQTPFFYNPKDKRKEAKTFNISSCLKFLKSLGISLENFVLGSPAYGHTWVCDDGMFSKADYNKKALMCYEKNNIEYCVIAGQSTTPNFNSMNQYFNQNQDCFKYDEVSKAAYFENLQDGNVVTFDDVRSLKDKIECVFDENMKGIFFWDLSGDVRFYKDQSKSLIYNAADMLRSHEEELQKKLQQEYIEKRQKKKQQKVQLQQLEQQQQQQQDESNCNVF